ncbi:hypothetical protein [Pleionea sp. CnH1-48]|uniref:amino acid kinase family protein n=1 Tax=Pleionea sp. CnH1-48 TaxID=2954494 RepID=UPI002096B774|nr:hypothetical protein [Pleionea sp. CnH1-48]MCO7224329.1 hypothetical protein [Pleionea sp. CnH1-48]
MKTNNDIITHKFGGSSLASTDCYQRLLNNVKSMGANDWIIVSASGKTTNSLKSLYDLAGSFNEQALRMLEELKQYHQKLIKALTSEHQKSLLNALEQDLIELKEKVEQSHHQKPHTDEFLYYGEVWSARLLTAFLSEQQFAVTFINAADILVLKGECVDIEASLQNLTSSQLMQQQGLKVVTGYIAADVEGNICTLGRNGSDYSASLFARLTHAQRVQFWTDVNGVYSADPGRVDNAQLLPFLNWNVAHCLAKAGSPILHHKTLQPLAEVDCDVVVRSSFHPEQQGTRVMKSFRDELPLLSTAMGFGLVHQPDLAVEPLHLAFELTPSLKLIYPEYVECYENAKHSIARVNLVMVCNSHQKTAELIEQQKIHKLFHLHLNAQVELIVTNSSISQKQIKNIHDTLLEEHACLGYDVLDFVV